MSASPNLFFFRPIARNNFRQPTQKEGLDFFDKPIISLGKSDFALSERDTFLKENWSSINSLVNQMDRDTSRCLIKEGPEVGMRAPVVGQVRDMQVNNWAAYALNRRFFDQVPIAETNNKIVSCAWYAIL